MEVFVEVYAFIGSHWPLVAIITFEVAWRKGQLRGVAKSAEAMWNLLHEDDKETIRNMKINRKNQK